MTNNDNVRSRHGSGTISPQSRLQSSGSGTPRSRHHSEEASRSGWHQNEEVTSRSRHRSEEWEQNPPVRGQEILQVNRGRQIINTCFSEFIEEKRWMIRFGRKQGCRRQVDNCRRLVTLSSKNATRSLQGKVSRSATFNNCCRSVRTQLHIAVADKRPFNVRKVQRVQLEQLKTIDSPIVTSKKGSDTPPIVMPSPKKGSNNTYSEYFDNLLSLIDKASKDLSL